MIKIPCQSETSKAAGVFSVGSQLAPHSCAVWGLPLIPFSRTCSGSRAEGAKGEKPSLWMRSRFSSPKMSSE